MAEQQKAEQQKAAVLVYIDKDTKLFIKDFHGLGQLKLRILVDSINKLNKRILVVRKAGMKLFDMDKISNSISFTGILELEGDNLNEYFRKIENPAHDNWENLINFFGLKKFKKLKTI